MWDGMLWVMVMLHVRSLKTRYDQVFFQVKGCVRGKTSYVSAQLRCLGLAAWLDSGQ